MTSWSIILDSHLCIGTDCLDRWESAETQGHRLFEWLHQEEAWLNSLNHLELCQGWRRDLSSKDCFGH